MKTPLRILHLEDNVNDAELVSSTLELEGYPSEIVRVETNHDFTKALESGRFDLIISDFSLPSFDGLSALEIARKLQPDIPFIFVSGTLGEDAAIEALKRGATDYVIKNKLAKLVPAVRRCLEEVQERAKRKKAEDELRESYEFIQRIGETTPNILYVLDFKSFELRYLNQTAIRALGYTKKQIESFGTTLFKTLMHPDDYAKLSQRFSSFSKASDTDITENEHRIRDANNVWRWFLARETIFIRNEDQSPRLIMGTAMDITERKQAEEALRESEERLRMAITATSQGLFDLDVRTGDAITSPEYAQMLGYEPGELQETFAKWLNRIHPDDRNKALNGYKKYFSGQQDENSVEIRQQTKSGEWKWFFTIGKAVESDNNGRPLRIIGTQTDITQRKQAEEALRISEEKYRSLIKQMNDGLMLVDNNDVIQFVNEKLCKIFEYTKEELIGKIGYTMLLPEESWNLLQEKNRQRKQGISDQYELEMKKKSGKRFWVSVSASPIYDPKGEVIGSIATVSDISERKRAEEKIKEQAELLDVDPDAILVVSLEGRILFWSKGAERLLGWRQEEAVGKHVREILGESPFQLEQIREELLKTDRWKGESKKRAKDGKELIVDSSCVLVRDNEGNPKAVYIVASDITEKKKLEAQFLRAQRMESIGTLAGGIAHDLNNILAPILLAIEMLRMKYPHESDQALLNTLEASARRGAGVVKQVLTFARGVDGERTEIQLKHLVSEFEKIARDTFPRSIQITTRTSKDLWTTTGDPTQFYQILMNLGVNARDAMPKGGKLQIEMENILIDEQYARMHVDAKQGPYVVISVSDTGTGMPPQVIDKIFEPFFTTKETGKGTGLGLSTVVGIIKTHGGFVNVYSEVGKGTTFKVYLPAHQTSETRKTKEERPELPVGNGELILVVDDEAAIREITKATLETYGYKVQDANDGTEGVAIYAQNLKEIKLVLTDMMMPFMDGPAMIRALQKLNPEVKVIAVSGLADNVKVVEIAGTGDITFLQKPFTTEKLLKTLREVLDKNL